MEINDISEDDIITEEKYYIKKTLESLKRRKNGDKTAKTAGTIKNTENNLIIEDNHSRALEHLNPRSYTEMGME